MIQTAVGIELTSPDLRIAVTRRVLNKYTVLRSAVIEGFSSLPPDQQVDVLGVQARKLALGRYPIFLNLPRESGIIRQLELPTETVRNMKAIVALQVETLSPWETADIYWDFTLETPVKSARLVKVTIAIIPREFLDPLLELFKAAGLRLSGASLAPLAWVHSATVTRQTSTEPLVVVAAEAGQIHGILLRDGWLTSTSLGRQGSVRGSINAVWQRLVALAHIDGSQKVACFCQEQLAKDLDNAGPADEEVSEFEVRPFSGETTAALVELKKGPFRSNLIPVELRHRRSRLALASAGVSVGLCILLGLALLLQPGYQGVQYLKQLQGEIDRMAPAMSQIASQESQLNALNATYAATTRAIQDRDRNLEALREVAVTLPPSTWLVNYAYQDGSVTLSGLSENASQVQKALEASPVFAGVQFVSPITREPSGKERFIIRAAVQKKDARP